MSILLLSYVLCLSFRLVLNSRRRLNAHFTNTIFLVYTEKSNITKILNSEENLKLKVPNQMAQSQIVKHIKRIDNNYHIPELVQAFSYVENS